MKRDKAVFSILLVGLALLVMLPIASAQNNPTTVPAAPTAPEHPYLGVRLEDTPAGVVVREVIAGQPAAAAGLQLDDIILKINDKAIANVYQASQAIDSMKVNDSIKLDITRAGQAQTLTAKLMAVPERVVEMVPSNMPFDAVGYDHTGQSWTVYSLAEQSALYTAGLRQEDVISKLNGKTYAPADLQTFIKDLKSTDMVTVTYQRNEKSSDVQISASALKALNLLGYEDQALLFHVVRPANAENQPVTPTLPFNMPFDGITYNATNHNWMIFGLEEGGALYNAGLRTGDLITQFDGKTYTPAEFQEYRESLNDTAAVKVTVERAGQPMEINVPAADLNVLDLFDASSGSLLFGFATTPGRIWLGADTRSITEAFAQEHHLKVNTGVMVIGIMPDSPAAQAGLQANDIISGIGQDTVANAPALQKLLSNYKPGDQITLDVMRGDNTMKINATLGEPDISGEIPFLTPAQ